jgi:hypothetical protein
VQKWQELIADAASQQGFPTGKIKWNALMDYDQLIYHSNLPIQANLTSASQQSGQPIRLGLSLWPGAIPWQIAEDKGFLNASGVNAEITWFQTLADQLNAFTAGKIDIANLTLTELVHEQCQQRSLQSNFAA